MNESSDAELLYTSACKIYPRKVSGRFATLRKIAVSTLLGIYYVVPWLRWDDRQAILFDLPARKFHLFGWTLWPQDFIYLTFLLALAAYSLFFFTALAGRLWCGYACPQTVWTELFIAIERWIEGDRRRQMQLDAGAWTVAKLRTKTIKHSAWLLLAAWTGFTFVGYFSPIVDLAARTIAFNLGAWETFWIVFYSFATWGNAGFMREQVCKYMCPYARFQSAMFDRDTLIVTYDATRGEKRGSRRRGEDFKARGLGDCVDCTLCVQVCPTGIDIRDGLQYECIACSACIDACDSVMERVGYAPGLIRYDTQNGLDGKRRRIVRPRIVIYSAILVLLCGLFVWSVFLREPLALDVIRDRNALYRETSEGLIENVYLLKVINMSESTQRYRIAVDGLSGARLVSTTNPISVAGGEVANVPVSVQVDEDNLTERSSVVYFNLETVDPPEVRITEEARFLGPRR